MRGPGGGNRILEKPVMRIPAGMPSQDRHENAP